MWSYIFYIYFQLKTKTSLKSDYIQKNFLKKLNTVFFLAGIAPLAGLLGTVEGIIEIFSGIGKTQSINADVMAEGIGKALTTTQIGLVIAIPGLAAGNFIKEKYCFNDKWNIKKEKKMRYKRREKNIVNDLNITPLLDMVFILLIFFVVTSSFITSKAVDISLPKASTGKEVSENAGFISIDKTGELFLNNEKTGFEQMKNNISELSGKTIVVAPDKEVSSGRLIEVIDFLRSNNITQIAVSVEENEK